MAIERPFGQWLKQRRMVQDVTQSALAERVGCSVDMIQKIEAGTRRPSRPMAERLAICLGAGPADITALVELARAALPGRQSPLPSPYRGLLPFRAEDAPFFFGREEHSQQLALAVCTRPLVAVTGAPASGKSSLLMAGLVPRLTARPVSPLGAEGTRCHQQHEAVGWHVAACHPGRDPFCSLAGSLIPLLEGPLSVTDRLIETHKLARALDQGNLGLPEVAEQILESPTGTWAPDSGIPAGLLLIVDQFEELYMLCRDPRANCHFVEVLLDATGTLPEASVQCGVVIGLRTEYVEQLQACTPLGGVLDGGLWRLPSLGDEERRRAVECPAEELGVRFESGLVERILAETRNGCTELALLELTLAELWRLRSDRLLTHCAYEALNGAAGVFARHASELYARFSPRAQGQLEANRIDSPAASAV